MSTVTAHPELARRLGLGDAPVWEIAEIVRHTVAGSSIGVVSVSGASSGRSSSAA